MAFLFRSRQLFSSLARFTPIFCCFVAVYFLVSVHENLSRYDARPAARSFSTVNETWMKLRKELLEEKGPTKVFLFTYMRGGSSLLGELFKRDPMNSVMFYEPLDAFYQSYYGFFQAAIPLSLLYENNLTQRSLSDSESAELTEYLESLFTCRVNKLPIETFAHRYLGHATKFNKTTECMARNQAQQKLHDCTKKLGSICGNVDAVRRNVSVARENKCPEIIRALRTVLPEPPVSSEPNRGSNRSVVDVLEMRKKISNLVESFSSDDDKRFASFLDYHTCRMKAKSEISRCLDSAETTCRSSRLIAMKVIRSRMKDLEALIQRIPDIHVVYYTRDPRAIVSSRRQLSYPLTYNSDKSVVEEAKILCHRMWDDLEAKRRLEVKYPGAIMTLHYEDFVRDLNGSALRIFDRIGYEAPAKYFSWIRDTVRGSSSDGPYGTRRANVTASIHGWHSAVTSKDGLEMTRTCQSLLNELGYKTYE